MPLLGLTIWVPKMRLLEVRTPVRTISIRNVSFFFVDTLYVLGEIKALKNEAVPNLLLPQKSTFKIKISKKDSGKQIKVEEVKVKEEKVEKPEKAEKVGCLFIVRRFA